MSRPIATIILSLSLALPMSAAAVTPKSVAPVLTQIEIAHGGMGCHRRVVPGPCCHAGPDVYHCH